MVIFFSHDRLSTVPPSHDRDDSSFTLVEEGRDPADTSNVDLERNGGHPNTSSNLPSSLEVPSRPVTSHSLAHLATRHQRDSSHTSDTTKIPSIGLEMWPSNNDLRKKAKQIKKEESKKQCCGCFKRLSFKQKITFHICLLILVLGIALGLGLGISLGINGNTGMVNT